MAKVLRTRHGIIQPRFWGYVPNIIGELVHPIYLGLPPLPISRNRPLLTKGDNESVATLSGISAGGAFPSSKSPSSKSGWGSSQRINFGSDIGSGQIKGKPHRKANSTIVRSGSNPNGSKKKNNVLHKAKKTVKKLLGRGRKYKKDSKGRFVK